MQFLSNFCLVLTKMASELCPACLTEVLENLGGVAWEGILWGTVNVQLKRSPSSFCLDHRGWDNLISGRWEVDSGVKAWRAMARLIPLLLREKRATLALCGGWEKPYFPRSEFTCMVTHWSWSFDAYYEETIGTWHVQLLFFFLFLTPSLNIPPSPTPHNNALSHMVNV